MKQDKSPTYRSLERVSAGDEKGLETLLERHLPWIRDHVKRRLGPALKSRAETCDFVQDAMIQFLRYGPRVLVSSDEHFRGLLVRIIENAIRDRRDWFMAQRRCAAKERPLPSDTVLNLDPPKNRVHRPSQVADQREREAWIRLALEVLDPPDRDILVWRQWEGLPFAEIAERLEISAEAAWKRHKTAVGRLARVVGELRKEGIAGLTDGCSFSA